jgi:hypothetical protein
VYRGKKHVGVFVAVGILAPLAGVTAVVMLPRLIGMLFADPAVITGAGVF